MGTQIGIMATPDMPGNAYVVPALAAATTSCVPILGSAFSDNKNGNIVRAEHELYASFGPVNFYFVKDALLTAGFVVQDKSHVYFNTSLVYFGRRGFLIREFKKKNGNNSNVKINSFQPNMQTIENDLTALSIRGGPDVCTDYEEVSAFICHNEGGGTWGHYLIQNLPKIMAAKEFFPHLKMAIPNTQYDNNSVWCQLLRLSGLEKADFIPIDRSKQYRFKEAVFCDFLWDFTELLPHPKALEYLESVREAVTKRQRSVIPASSGTKLFIERAPVAARNIENLDEIKAICKGYDFNFASLSNMPVAEQICQFAFNDLIVATLGSDLAGVVFAKPGTKILSLSPVWHADSFFYNLAATRGLIWNEISCSVKVNENQLSHRASFILDAALFTKMIQTIL